MSDITRVGGAGCGLMGFGIAGICARAGLDVVVREIDHQAIAAGSRRIEASPDRAVTAGKLTDLGLNARTGTDYRHHRTPRPGGPSTLAGADTGSGLPQQALEASWPPTGMLCVSQAHGGEGAGALAAVIKREVLCGADYDGPSETHRQSIARRALRRDEARVVR